ncbi:glutathione S-transferase [Ramlibacter sp. G-1-2-2]|uniref:Glutathione S-transferase n=1 Tax=Ramlibacter agri TaxID=2728837 RepID=A0A848HJ91_9BURK|nr:glutathione S-transferase [Ramlibacter agri]NML48583.1 glutathione S-transferase [Ramlibacter agri]
MYQLHGFCQSGNTWKAALALDLLGQPWQPVFVDYFGGATRDAAWRDGLNEMGEAPVLQDGELRLTQSGLILLHLARKHGRFGGEGEDQQREVLRWILYDNHKFTSYFASHRWQHAFAPEPTDPAVTQWLRSRIDHAFGLVDKHLQSRDFMVGTAPTVADFSLCGYLFFPPEESGYDVRKQYPAIGRWMQRIAVQPGFRLPYDCLPGERIAPRR